MRGARLGMRGRATGWWVLLAAVIVVFAANAALAQWSHGSTSHGSTSHGGAAKPSGPSMVRARSVAAQEFGLLSGGGWTQAWALWSAAGQAALVEADFVRLNTQCRPPLGEPYVLDAATDIDATDVRVDWHQGSVTGTGTMVFEGGAWKFQPDAQTLAEYRRGVTAVAADRKAAGSCH
jgi:hypothetical protein